MLIGLRYGKWTILRHLGLNNRSEQIIECSCDCGVVKKHRLSLRPKGLQIDRTNNNGNYEPGNCRWVTPKENHSNRNILKNKKEN